MLCCVAVADPLWERLLIAVSAGAYPFNVAGCKAQTLQHFTLNHHIVYIRLYTDVQCVGGGGGGEVECV